VETANLRFETWTQPTAGSLIDIGNNRFTYQPHLNFSGSDRFTYTVSDRQGGTASASVIFTVEAPDLPPNQAPVAGDDAYTLLEDQPLSLTVADLLANDSDPNGDSLSLSLGSPAQFGTVTLGNNGTLIYTPQSNFVGSDRFTYILTDGRGGTDTGEVTLGVGAVNDRPTALDDLYTLNSHDPFSLDFSALLANDTDPDGDSLSVSSWTQPQYGTLVATGDGGLTYTPPADFAGKDQFSYSVSDGQGGSHSASVSLEVPPVVTPASPVRIFAVTDRMIALNFEVNDIQRQGQIPYEFAAGDAIDAQGWLRRNNQTIGRVVGRNQETLYLLDQFTAYDLDVAWASQTGSYRLSSTDDASFQGGRSPVGVSRKTKITDSARIGSWAFGFRKDHTLFLELDQPLTEGQSYRLDLQNGSITFPEQTYTQLDFTYDPATVRSDAVHVTHLGFDPDDATKYGYLSMGTGVGNGDANGYGQWRSEILEITAQGSYGQAQIVQEDGVDIIAYRLDRSAFEAAQPSRIGSDTLTYTIQNRQGETFSGTLTLDINLFQQAFQPLKPQGGDFSTWQEEGKNVLKFREKDLINYSAQVLDLPVTPGFSLVDGITGETVYSGRLTQEQLLEDPNRFGPNRNGSDVYRMDFSDFNTPGTYALVVEGVGRSYDFTIGETVWDQAFYTATRGLYHQRSGIALEQPYTDWERPRSLHPDDGLQIYESTAMLVNTGEGLLGGEDFATALTQGNTGIPTTQAWGGWHDAGDWDRRIQHTQSVRELLELVELNATYFAAADLNLPESDNHLPDVIDEALWGLDVFRRLQRADGAVSGGVEGSGSPDFGEGSWHEDDPWFTYAPDPWSSYEYASAAAKAAYVLQTYDPTLAAVYRDSALRAMVWAEANPLAVGQDQLTDSRNLAAAELYRLTGDSQWHDVFLESSLYTAPRSNINDHQYDAAFVYLTTNRDRNGDVMDQAYSDLQRNANLLVSESSRFAFGELTDRWTPIGWGGGGITPARGINLARFHYLSGDQVYRDRLLEGSLFGLGSNPDNLTFMTGLGHQSPNDPLIEDVRALGSTPPPGIGVYGQYDLSRYGYFFGIGLHPSDITAQGSLPVNESYQDFFYDIPLTEFTIQQSVTPNAYVWGYLAATDANATAAVVQKPTAIVDRYSIQEDQPLQIRPQDLLANDRDPQGDSLSVGSLQLAASSRGQLSAGADGSYTYTPAAGFHGEDYLIYSVSDGQGNTDYARVLLDIATVADAPVVGDDAFAVVGDRPISFVHLADLLANDSDQDGDPLTILRLGDPSHGSLSQSASGLLQYQATEGFGGTDTFTYTVGDGQGNETQGTVSLHVTDASPGLTYGYYPGSYSVLPDFETITPLTTGFTPDFSLSPREQLYQYALRFQGFVDIAQADTYRFYTRSDEGSALYINGEKVVDNDGTHTVQERSGSVFLSQGLHQIVVDYFQRWGSSLLEVAYDSGSLSKQAIPTTALFTLAHSTLADSTLATLPNPSAADPLALAAPEVLPLGSGI